MKIKTTEETLINIIDRMEKSNKVFFIRFGDNDISQMSGYSPRGRKLIGNETLGRNETIFSVDQQRDLQKSFYINNKNYLIAVTGQWPFEKGMKKGLFGSKKYEQTLKDLDNLRDRNIYFNPIIFHYMMIFQPKRLKEFFDKYINGKILFVGNMKNYNIFGDFIDKVDTPLKNAYEYKRDILKKVKEKIKENDYDIIILGCGQVGRAIAHNLWDMKEKFHCIDIGSIVDVFDNKITRRWIRKGKAKNNLKYFNNEYNIVNNNSKTN